LDFADSPAIWHQDTGFIMSILTVLEFPDPRLRTKAKTVAVFDDTLRQLVADMYETMYAERGVGLAATQVDQHLRLFVMDVSDGNDQPKVLVNPRIIEKRGAQVEQEGCLSFPGVFANVERASWVKAQAQDADGKAFEIEAEGLMAVCIQHELDHLDGKVFVDHLSPLKRSMLLKRMEKQRRVAS
jgi:peptide deformylase